MPTEGIPVSLGRGGCQEIDTANKIGCNQPIREDIIELKDSFLKKPKIKNKNN